VLVTVGVNVGFYIGTLPPVPVVAPFFASYNIFCLCFYIVDVSFLYYYPYAVTGNYLNFANMLAPTSCKLEIVLALLPAAVKIAFFKSDSVNPSASLDN